MKINPLNNSFFLKKIDESFNIFYIYGHNLGLIDICYSKLKKNLAIDFDNPFKTNYFDENKLLNNTESFFDEFSSISLFGDKKTLVVDIRQSDKKNNLTNIFSDFDFSKIKDTQLIIVSYIFQQNDILTKKILNSKNAICFPCYEESEYNIKNNLRKELVKINLNLNESQIDELTIKFSKDTKIIQNTFEKFELQNKNTSIDFDQLLALIDNNNDKNVFEMINKLLSGNYYESVYLLNDFERVKTSGSSILHVIKIKLILLQKCINMKMSGLTKKEIVNNKSLKIFYKEQPFIFKMLDLWSLNNINSCLYHLFKTDINCKSKKDYEYIFLRQLFLYIYLKIKI